MIENWIRRTADYAACHPYPEGVIRAISLGYEDASVHVRLDYLDRHAFVVFNREFDDVEIVEALCVAGREIVARTVVDHTKMGRG